MTPKESILIEPWPFSNLTRIPLAESSGTLETLDNILRRNQALRILLGQTDSPGLGVADQPSEILNLQLPNLLLGLKLLERGLVERVPGLQPGGNFLLE